VLAGRIEIELDGAGSEILGGRLVRTWDVETAAATHPMLPLEVRPAAGPASALPLGLEEVDEVAWIASWLDRNARRLTLVSCSEGLAHPARRMPDLEPVSPRRSPDGVRAVA